MGYTRKPKNVPRENTKTREELEGSYSTVVVEGTGTKSQFIHLSDRLVRGSRIFWRLSEKILEAKRLCGFYRAAYQRTKKDLKSITAAFKQYERDADKLFKIQEKKIESLTARLSSQTKTTKRAYDKIKGVRFLHAKTMKNNEGYKKEYMVMKRYRDFFTKRLSWKQGKSEGIRVEMFLRTIFEYKQLESKKELNHIQMMYLAVGHQMDAFNRKHIETRFGVESCSRFGALMKDLIDKGYIRRFERRNYFYVTEDGRAYFSKLLKEIYVHNYPNYWTEVAQNIKYE